MHVLYLEQNRILHGEPRCLRVQDRRELNGVGATSCHILMEKPQDVIDYLWVFLPPFCRTLDLQCSINEFLKYMRSGHRDENAYFQLIRPRLLKRATMPVPPLLPVYQPLL